MLRLNVIGKQNSFTGCDSCQTDLLIAIFKLKVSFERKNLSRDWEKFAGSRCLLGEDPVIESAASGQSIRSGGREKVKS